MFFAVNMYKINEGELLNKDLCIIVRKSRKIWPLTSTDNGKEQIRDAANSRHDYVYHRLELLSSNSKTFLYFVSV